MNSDVGKHIGADPSQQPPDWWNISGPCCARRRRSTAAASGVIPTRATAGVVMTQKKPWALGV